MVHRDEDAGAELDGLRGVVQGIDGEGAPADAVRLLEYGDVDRDVLLRREALQMVGRRGSSRTGT